MGCKHLIGEARKTMFLGNVYTNIDFSQNIFSKFTARGTLRVAGNHATCNMDDQLEGALRWSFV